MSRRLIAAGIAAAVLPDADVIGFRFGVPYASEFGHRGASHSLAFALLLGLIAATLAPRLQARRWTALLFVGLSAASHGLADMLTDGGRGVVLFWPLTSARYFFPARPIEVSPIGLPQLGSDRMLAVLGSEALWLLLPAAILALFVSRWRPIRH